MRLANKLAVVTAAASGMGRAGVELFLREGARVAAIDIDADALAALAAEMRAKGHEIETVRADLSRGDEVRRSIAEAVDRLGGVDILWAHAGTPGPAGVENLDMAAYDHAISLNITSATLAAGEIIGHMRKRGGGSVVFTASVSGLVGSMFSPVYSAAKFAVVGLTKSLAQRFAADNVRVNVVCPGLADTPMKLGFTGRSGDPREAAANQERMLAAVPMGRLCKAEEAAHAVLWLASDDASFVTGVALPVDGGFTAR
ncbi:2,5-dichloro-2,5-cyclohexadiene-1,4-diol dehydrogenase [Azospirillum thiophilum]|uniref:2,5-dichloro-2,5-cyclohexadiene-1,4-diol dehydrogenase n=1 Tax=Azospirillum thiophilum TaxID=528244 RepID=A0AAC8ZVU8_9PROT|nr:SDR family NAD(P)-dependent oxidoreductase [Azospirillum thiophilum]ALG74589.1 2,5-dichloro-2,5-cyclohexadiene-1,4-diol dehydrogenase [Azospirillum thiophilum]KJR61763.1 2,5-dichloro-2,5-cyclohexadiene-1,4-diol dehydrogenase [Azospirillum thiophilum]